MIPKPTEDTITGLLRDELEKRKVKVAQFVSLNTPAGIRKPDLLCQNGGVYLIEAKFSEAQILDAVAKIQNDYLKHHKTLEIKGGFAVLYPREMAKHMPLEVLRTMAFDSVFKLIAMFPPDDPRPFTVKEGKLGDIANAIAEFVLLPPETVEPSVSYIIRTLRETANYIVAGLRHVSKEKLKEFFGGENVFKNILQYEEGDFPEEELKLAAAYILVNQLLFYHVLSKTRRTQFEPIDPDSINDPVQLDDYFQKVLDINYRAVFSFQVASLIPKRFAGEIRKIINVVQGLAPEKVGGDLLGTIFHDLIPFDVRKRVAAFYTNVMVAELLANLAIDDTNVRVADFAVGSGGLLVAAYRRKRDLLGRPMTEDDHRRFVEKELFGVDVMPFAANVAAGHLALQAPQFLTDRANIAVWDATELKPGAKIPSIADIKVIIGGQTTLDVLITKHASTKGRVKLREQPEEEHEIELQPFDVVIMNPPFTRQERIPEQYKSILVDRFKEQYGAYLHGQLGYHGYFILLADRFLKEGGRMALVLPATVLRIQSFEGIRRLLAEKYHIEYIITTSHRSAFSESSKFREILFIGRKEKEHSPSATTKIVTLKKLPKNPSESRKLAEFIRKTNHDFEDDDLVLTIYDYDKIKKKTRNWFTYIAISDPSLISLIEELLESNNVTSLSKVVDAQRVDLEHFSFKNFHGFIVFEKSRALKKIDPWIFAGLERDSIKAVHREFGWNVRVPTKVLGRGLRRLSYVQTMDVSDNSDFLILSWFEGLRDMMKVASTDTEQGSFDKSILESWRRKFDSRKSHLLLARRLDLSAPGTSHIAFYSDAPLVGVDMWSLRGIEGDHAKALTLFLNSTFNLAQILISRIETRGAWMVIHDYMLNDISVPNVDELSRDKLGYLLRVFDAVKKLNFPSILEQLKTQHEARKAIDLAWLKVLGYRGNHEETLQKLYKSLADEITILKQIMSEGALR